VGRVPEGASRRPASGGVLLLGDTLQLALAELRLGGVTRISLDDEWSAMRVKTV